MPKPVAVDVYAPPGNVPFYQGTPAAGLSYEEHQGLVRIQLDVPRVVQDLRKCPRQFCKAFKKSGRRYCVAHLPSIPVSAGGDMEDPK